MRFSFKFVMAVALGAIVTVPLGLLIWRSSLQNTVSVQRAITSTNGIDMMDVVKVGGIRQAIQVRGEDRENPVLLFVHGGPGTPMMPFSHVLQNAWEKHFVVVNWDQRGAGKTYYLNDVTEIKKGMSFKRMEQDVLEMTNYLRARFDKKKIFIMGHSFGSQISLPVVKSHPDFYYAYIGTGQIINGIRGNQNTYDHTLTLARKVGNRKAVRELEAVGQAFTSENALKNPKEWNDAVGVLQDWNQEFGESIFGYNSRAEAMLNYVWSSPDYDLREMWILMNVDWDLYNSLFIPRMTFDAYQYGKKWSVPVFLLEGRYDWQINYRHAKDYFDYIDAPHKEFFYFENGAHAPMFEEKDRYSEVLIKRIRPLAGDRPVQDIKSAGEYWINSQRNGREWKLEGPTWTP